MKCFFSVLIMAIAYSLNAGSTCYGGAITFGNGTNTFQMEFVTIGDAGNAPDTTGAPNPAGGVGYTYGIAKFEVREDMIAKYNSLNQGLQITKDTRGANKPATNVNWNEAARFVNWLNTSTGGYAPYKFTTSGVNDNIELWNPTDSLDYDASNPYRSKRATYVLPSSNEWYKAAFYNPNDSTYYNFATGSNTAPMHVASGTDANTAVYNQPTATGPADVDKSGGLSPYGGMGLSGNVFEWEESSGNRNNSSGTSSRGLRGGGWDVDSSNFTHDISSSSRLEVAPSLASAIVGFRVVTLSPSSPPAVPEPSMMVIGTLFGAGGLLAKRRIKK